MSKELLLEIKENLTQDRLKNRNIQRRDIFLENTKVSSKKDLESAHKEYNSNRRSEYTKRINKKITKIRKLLVTKSNRAFKAMMSEQTSLIEAVLHYWLDKGNRKLYKKNTRNNSLQLVVAKEDRIKILKACHDDIGHRGRYATEELLQQRVWWPKIKENAVQYIRIYYIYQIRQKRALELPLVVIYILSIF